MEPDYYSKKIVKCSVCMSIFSREDGTEYSYTGSVSDVHCPNCKTGHLWLFDTRIDKERMREERYKLDHPSLSEKVSNGCHEHKDEIIVPPSFWQRLKTGFKWINGDD